VCVSMTFNEFQLLELFLRGFEDSYHSVSLDLSGPRHLFYKTVKKWFWWKGLVRSVCSVRHNHTKLLEVPRKSSEALLEQKKQATILLGLVSVGVNSSFQLCRHDCKVLASSYA